LSGDRWIPARPEFYVQTGGMHENPFGVPRDEIIRMVLENPPEISAQVIFGKYVESSGLVFTSEIIQQLFDRSIPRVLGNYWHDPAALSHAHSLRSRFGEYGSPYHGGVDVARQTDYTVISVLDTSVLPARLVYYKRLNRVPWETIYTEVGRAMWLFGPNFLMDETGIGDVVLDAVHARMYCPRHKETVLVGSRCMRHGQPRSCKVEEYLSLSAIEGYQFGGGTGQAKKQLVEHLRNCMGVGYSSQDPERSFGWLRVPPIVQLEDELTFYTWLDKGLDTDCLFSLALAAWSGLEDPVDDPEYGSVYGD
jgi:hypothetical protein